MSKIKTIIQPITEELGKFGETARKQVSPDAEKSDEKKAKDETAQLVKDIYKPQEENTPEELLKKQEEAKKKEAQLRQALEMHKTTYYDPLVNRSKKPEEKPAEKVERQKMEEIQQENEKDKEKEKKKIAVIRAQQKVEKHPGASG